MNTNLNKLKKYEERVNRVIEDPIKIIKKIEKIINLSAYEGPLPVPEELKVTYFDFVEYIAKNQLERIGPNDDSLEEIKKFIAEIEDGIRAVGGFSDETLPDGYIVNYK